MNLLITDGILALSGLSKYTRFKILHLRGILNLGYVRIPVDWEFNENDIIMTKIKNAVEIKSKRLSHICLVCYPLLDGIDVIVDNNTYKIIESLL